MAQIDNGDPKIMKFLKRIIGLPAAVLKAVTVTRIVDDRKIVTPWGGKLLHVQLAEMKNKERYVQLVLVDGDVNLVVALDAIGANQLQEAVREFLSEMASGSRDQGN